MLKLPAIFSEFELVKQALYTDPDDQSAWIYHRWLTRGGKRFRNSSLHMFTFSP